MLIASYDLRIKDTMSAYCQLQNHKQLFASICMQYIMYKFVLLVYYTCVSTHFY